MIGKIDERESAAIYVMKSLALISVFYAHMARNDSCAPIIRSLCDIAGCLGVPIFFILSGYLFNRPQKGRKTQFWRKKVAMVIAPWILLATLTFIVSLVVSHGRPSVLAWLKWVAGVGTWYYFVSVLLVCFLMFSFSTSSTLCVLFLASNVVSIFLTERSIISMPAPLTNYLNVFNWIGFFAIGILSRKFWNSNYQFKKFLLPMLIGIALVLVDAIIPGKKTYWRVLAFFEETTVFVGLSYLCYALVKLERLKTVLIEVGKDSYFIYLIHMQIAGIVYSRLRFVDNENATAIVLPFLTWAFVSFGAVVLVAILKRLELDVVLRALGVR